MPRMRGYRNPFIPAKISIPCANDNVTDGAFVTHHNGPKWINFDFDTFELTENRSEYVKIRDEYRQKSSLMRQFYSRFVRRLFGLKIK